jgi:hypothetical protein
MSKDMVKQPKQSVRASFICILLGVLSIILSFTGYIGLITAALGTAAGLKAISDGDKKGAKVGIAFCILGLIASIWWILFNNETRIGGF